MTEFVYITIIKYAKQGGYSNFLGEHSFLFHPPSTFLGSTSQITPSPESLCHGLPWRNHAKVSKWSLLLTQKYYLIFEFGGGYLMDLLYFQCYCFYSIFIIECEEYLFSIISISFFEEEWWTYVENYPVRGWESWPEEDW